MLFAAVVWGTALEAQTQRPLGPAPRDGKGRFVNSAGELPRAGLAVALPFFLRRTLGIFRSGRGAPEWWLNDGAALRRSAGGPDATITWVGHATLLVQLGGLSFLTDPVWSSTASPIAPLGPRRFVEPGLRIETLPPIDFVVISHNHFDHMDLATLRRLAERGSDTRFLVPLGNAATLRDAGVVRVEELDWGGRLEIGGVRVHCLPAQHWSRRGVRDFQRALWASWAIIGAGRRFYFAGDSGYFEGFSRIGRELGPFDLAALPIGAYEPQAMMRPWHLDPEQAVRAAADLGARRVVAIHFGTFDLSDEPLGEPPRRLRAAARASGREPESVWILAVGETRRF